MHVRESITPRRLVLGVCAAALAGLPAATASAAIVVRFEQPAYTALQGQPLTVTAVIDGDDQLPGLQPVPTGLQSAGLALTYDPARANVPSTDRIVITPALNFGAVGGPADKSVASGRAGFVGNVEATTSYTGSALGTFTLDSLTAGTYNLGLELFFPLADTRANFVNGNIDDIDASITFAPSTVVIAPIPEPTLIALAMPAGMLLLSRRRRTS